MSFISLYRANIYENLTESLIFINDIPKGPTKAGTSKRLFRFANSHSIVARGLLF